MTKKSDTPAIRFKGFTDTWEQRKLGDIFKYEQPQAYIVESTEYDDRFQIPVLTAGQSFVLGYTDEDFGIKNANHRNPVVIFDDFTTSSHYVDFPFKVKSSAMKLLSLVNGKDDIHCAYNVLQNIGYEPVSHERHWISTFAKFNVYMPKNSTEQKCIGNYFANLDNLITLHQRKYDKLTNVKKSMLEKMFPKNGSNVPEIRFKGFTEAWEQRKLGDVAKYRNGKAHENDISEQGKFIVVNSKFVSTNGEVRKFSNKQIEPLFKNEIAFVLSDVPNGRAIARTFLVDKNDKYTLNQRIAGITPIEGTCPYFLHILMNRNKYFLQFDDGAKQTNLSVDDVIEFAEYYPSSEEQQQIGNFFRQLDNLITLHQRELEKLKNIKKSCLENMFV